MEQQMGDTMKQLPSLLEKLGNQLGVASAKVWEWSLLNVEVEIVNKLVWIGLTLLIVVGTIIYNKWINKNDIKCSTRDDLTGYGIINLILVALCIVGVIGSLVYAFQLPSLIINPEWNAFQNIMTEVGKLKS
jgi:hypothetical protein